MYTNSLNSDDEKIKKLQTYLNFAFRAKEVIIGFNTLEKTRSSKISVVLISGDLGESSTKKIVKIFNDKVISLTNITDIGELVKKPGIKILGLKTTNLGKTIQELLMKKENLPE